MFIPQTWDKLLNWSKCDKIFMFRIFFSFLWFRRFRKICDGPTFGEFLGDLRSKRGFTLGHLAPLLHFTKSTVHRYETGEQIPAIDTVEALCVVLDCSDLEYAQLVKRYACDKFNKIWDELDGLDKLREILFR